MAVLRTRLLIGVFIFVACVGFFKDTMLQWGIEAGLSKALDQTVEVERAQLQFFPLAISVDKLAVVSNDNVMKNDWQIASVNASLSLVGVLRRQVHVTDVSFLDLAWDVPREVAGKLWKRQLESQPDEGEYEPESGTKSEASTFRVASLFNKPDPRQWIDPPKLGLGKQADGLRDELKTFQSHWTQVLDGSLYAEDAAALAADYEQLKGANINALDDLNAVLASANALLDRAKAMKRQVDTDRQRMQGEYRRIVADIARVDDTLRADYAQILSKISIESLDTDRIRQQILADLLEKGLSGLRNIVNKWQRIREKNKPDLSVLSRRHDGVDVGGALLESSPGLFIETVRITGGGDLYRFEGVGELDGRVSPWRVDFSGDYRRDIGRILADLKIGDAYVAVSDSDRLVNLSFNITGSIFRPMVSVSSSADDVLSWLLASAVATAYGELKQGIWTELLSLSTGYSTRLEALGSDAFGPLDEKSMGATQQLTNIEDAIESEKARFEREVTGFKEQLNRELEAGKQKVEAELKKEVDAFLKQHLSF